MCVMETYIDVGAFGKRADRMHMVIEDYHSHHHSQAEHDSFFILEFTSIVSNRGREDKIEGLR